MALKLPSLHIVQDFNIDTRIKIDCPVILTNRLVASTADYKKVALQKKARTVNFMRYPVLKEQLRTFIWNWQLFRNRALS